MKLRADEYFAHTQKHPCNSHTKKTKETVHGMKLHIHDSIHDSYVTLTNMVQKERLNNYSL